MCGRYLFKPEDYPEILKSNAAKADDFQGGVVFPSTKAPIITKKIRGGNAYLGKTLAL